LPPDAKAISRHREDLKGHPWMRSLLMFYIPT
jgi:hypothetical protein